MTMSDHQDSEHFAYDKTWEEIETMLDWAEAQTEPTPHSHVEGDKKEPDVP